MNKRYFPEFSPEVELEIEQEQKGIHEKYWQHLRQFRAPDPYDSIFVDSIAHPPLESPPIKEPRRLAQLLRSYAFELFEAEAKRYTHSEYLNLWLKDLSGQILKTIMDRLGQMRFLSYHASDEEIEAAVDEALRTAVNQHLYALEPVPGSRAKKKQAKASQAKSDSKEYEAQNPKMLSEARRGMKDTYFFKFPQAMIIDVCWAARQHRREWDRWIKGEIKNGSKPDRLFRSVLIGNKAPSEIRPEERPKEWK